MNREKLLRNLQFFSTVVIPVMTLAVTATLTYLKEVNKEEEKQKESKKPENHD